MNRSIVSLVDGVVLREEPPLLAGVALGPGVVFTLFCGRRRGRGYRFGLFLPLGWCFWRLVLGVRRRLARARARLARARGDCRSRTWLFHLFSVAVGEGEFAPQLMLCLNLQMLSVAKLFPGSAARIAADVVWGSRRL